MIRTGTCSWTEKTLIKIGEFYPKHIRTAEERLKYYAVSFDTVEVDSTYYAIADKKTTYLWADRTPDDFIFHVKVYGALTGHGIEPATLPVELRRMLPQKDKEQKMVYIKEPSILKSVAQHFRESLYPLVDKGKLGILLFQFPPWFQYGGGNMDYIVQCSELMAGLEIAVEFRHGSWLATEHRDGVFNLLRRYRITYVTADEPQYGSLATVPFVPEVTTDTAYFRFHGRNKDNWLKKGIDTSLRYSYLYSENEVKEFKTVVKNADKKAAKTYAMFNNCHGGFAIRNAMKMKEELERE